MASALAGLTNVVLLAPLVRFERIEEGTTFASSGSSSDDLAASLQSAAEAAVASAHATLINCQIAESAEVAVLCKQLGAHSTSLARGSVKGEVLSVLRGLDEIQPFCAVLANSLVVYFGAGDSYNSMTGQIRSSMSKSVFSAVLIRCDTGELLWKNDVLLRAVSDVEDSGYLEALQLLYGGSRESL